MRVRHDGSQRLAGKRILLTGASSGVGLAAVERFLVEGAQLALVSRRDTVLTETLREEGLDAVVIRADLAQRDEAEDAVRQAVAALGGLDVVVANAGVATFGHFSEVHADDFDRTVAVTFTGAVDLIREALPHLRRSRGKVVATGSLMTRVPLPTWSSYTAAKHALRGFLNTLMIEEREQQTGVTVSMVHPGPIDTPLFGHASSATGRKPRVPPDSYGPEVIAQALVEATIGTRREIVLGGETRAIDILYGTVRPAAETILLVIDRWYRSGDERSTAPGSLWERPQTTQRSGGVPSRDSMLAPLQLGRGMLPSPATPLRLARNLAAAGVRAVALRRLLSRPVPERPRPDDGLRSESRPASTEQQTVPT